LETDLSPLAERAWLAWKEAGVDTRAPRLWLYEVTSAIHRVYMQGQIREEQALAALDIALELGVQLVPDDDLAHAAFRWATRLRRLATYDCFYLALAEHLGAELWTADRSLANAAKQAGLPWVRWIGELANGPDPG
jgi:predicted nucleic acid-binding protein